MAICREWCGACYAGLRGRETYKGHAGWRPKISRPGENLTMALRKRDASVASSTGEAVLTVCRLSERMPQLIEFLSAVRYEDGTARVLPTLTIFIEPGCFKACLNDRDQSLVAFITSGSLTGLLEALEAGIGEDTLEWRSPAQGYRKSRGKT